MSGIWAIQVSTVIARVSRELDAAIERLFPQRVGQAAPEPQHAGRAEALPEACEHRAAAVAAAAGGYLQGIDSDTLLRIAQEYDCLLRVQMHPGSFIVQGAMLVHVWPEDRLDESLAERVQAAFIVGPERTPTQDVEFCINQLVEVAVRALSPGINDPFTAITCIDHLGAALCRLAQRILPSPYRYDDEKHLRLIAHPVTFAGVTEAAVNLIRQYGRSSAAVTIRLLETLAVVAAYTHREEDRTALRRQAMMIERGSREGLPEEWDQQDVQERYQAVIRALQQRGE